MEPVLPSLIILLPLAGFAAQRHPPALRASTASWRSSAAVRAGDERDPFANGVRPRTHTLPTWIGPGVMALAFALAVWNFALMWGADLAEPVVVRYWSWIATGPLRVDAAIQLDQLSMTS